MGVAVPVFKNGIATHAISISGPNQDRHLIETKTVAKDYGCDNDQNQNQPDPGERRTDFFHKTIDPCGCLGVR